MENGPAHQMADQSELSQAMDALRRPTFVCNKLGQPIVLFHGSEIYKKSFDPKLSASKLGSQFTANKQIALRYARPYLYEAQLHLANPMTIPIQSYVLLINDDPRKQSILASGHDGLIVQNFGDHYYSVFSPGQVIVVAVSCPGAADT